MTRFSPRSREQSERSGIGYRLIDSALSLRCKTTGLVVIVSVTATAVVAGYLLTYSGRLARKQHEKHIVEAASLVARSASVYLAAGKQKELVELARDFANGMPLLYVVITDTAGKQLAVAQHGTRDVLQYVQQHREQRNPIAGKPRLIKNDSSVPTILDVTYPISMKLPPRKASEQRPAKLLGYAQTGLNADEWQRSISSIVDLVIGISTLAAVVAIPLGFFLVRRIVAPLDELSDAMTTFSLGKLDVRSSVIRRDEIGRLARVFNQMADLHQQTHERIVRLNAELEERVAYRTKQLKELASREPLTGLYNRRHFNEVLERAFSEAIRYGGDLSCIMIDLDRFKSTNDAFGHQTGDELLMITATTILSQLRGADVAARYGGDEFILLLPQTDAERAHVLAERIMKKFKREVTKQFPKISISMSLGVASLLNIDAKDAEARLASQMSLDDKKARADHVVDNSGSLDETRRRVAEIWPTLG